MPETRPFTEAEQAFVEASAEVIRLTQVVVEAEDAQQEAMLRGDRAVEAVRKEYAPDTVDFERYSEFVEAAIEISGLTGDADAVKQARAALEIAGQMVAELQRRVLEQANASSTVKL